MIPGKTLGRLRDLRKAKQQYEARADATLAEAWEYLIAIQACDDAIDALLDQARVDA